MHFGKPEESRRTGPNENPYFQIQENKRGLLQSMFEQI